MLSIFGKIIGDLAQAQWWPHSTWTVTIFSNHLGLPHFIAIGTIFVVWIFNVFGLRPAVWFSYACGILLMIPLALFIIVPYFTGDWHSSNVHATFTGPWGGFKVAIVYMFILAWSAYGTEARRRSRPNTRTPGATPPGRCGARRHSCCSCASSCRSASVASRARSRTGPRASSTPRP